MGYFPFFAGIVSGGSGPPEMTNAEKLALPYNTPVGTQVIVTDMGGILQELQAPSSTTGGATANGAGSQDANGVYSERGIHNGHPYYNLLGTDDNTVISAISFNGFIWEVWDSGGTLVLYASIDDTAFPWEATWEILDGLGPLPTFSNISIGELSAGVTSFGAGTPGANKTFTPRGIYEGHPYFNPLGEPDGIGGGSFYWNVIPLKWTIQGGGGANYVSADDVMYPWNASALSWVVEGTGAEPPPTIVRNDVATEANWLTI